jgi:hypothetical protein
MSKILPYLFAACLIHTAKAQRLFCEFDLESNELHYLQAFQVNDSVFFSFTQSGFKSNYWIGENGKKSEVLLNIPSDAPIVGLVQQDGKTYYYYLNNPNDNLILQVMEQTVGQTVIPPAHPIFPIPGELLGVHAEKTSVTIVSYHMKDNRVRILMVGGLTVLYDKLFDMPFNLVPHISHNSGFMMQNDVAAFEKGDQTFKLYREGNSVVISIDDDQLGKDNSKTSILKLDMATGKKEVHEIKRDDYDKFISFYHQGKVYQLVTSQKLYQCDIYDLKSGKIIFNKKIAKPKSLHQQKIFARRGKKQEVDYSDLYQMMDHEAEASIVVESAADTTQERLVLGTVEYFASGASTAVLFLGAFSSLIPAMIRLGVQTQSFYYSKYTTKRYLILKGNKEMGYDFEALENNPNPSIRQAIDEYEISRTTGRAKGLPNWNLKYKAYFQLNDGVLGIYQESGKKLTVLKYDNR